MSEQVLGAEVVAAAFPPREVVQGPRHGWLGRTWRRSPAGVVGAGILLFFVAVAVLAPVLSPSDPTVGSTADRLASPLTAGHILGTDGQGRDILSRLIWGSRPSLIIVGASVFVAGGIGLVVGAVAAVTGRLGRTLVTRALDVLLGLPPVMLAILVAASIGPGLRNMVIAITLVMIAPMTRIAYQSATVIKGLPYVEAAVAAGAKRRHLVAHQFVPNMLAPVLAYAASIASLMVVLGAGLSFVGLGIQPPQADWGRMINDGRLVLPVAPYVATIPGVALFLLAVGCNLLGDSLRDALDPRLRT
ncbi:MAG: transporter permease [Acidimicrobiales bacterium]|nr:transporter permease [Acidimicrobiales bacterium]